MAFVRLMCKAAKIEKLRRELEGEKKYALETSKGNKMKESLKQKYRHFWIRLRQGISGWFWRKCTSNRRTCLYKTMYKTRHDGTCENFTVKSVVGFISGFFLTYIFFMFFVFQLNFKLSTATIMCSIFGSILTIGLAFSYKVRCVVFLLLPQFFSKRGRQALMAYAFILAITGPAKNTLHNMGILSESMACGQEQLKAAVRQIIEAVKKPFYAIRDAIKTVVKTVKVIVTKIKEILLTIKRVIMAILRVIKAAFQFLGKILNICNKELGTPFQRCMRSFENAITDCNAKLGPLFNWMCSITYLVQSVCYIVKIFDFICIIVDFISDSIIGVVVRKVKIFIRHIRTMFYVRIKFSHSFHFETNQSKSISEITTGIVTEIRQRTDHLLTVFDIMSCATSLFFLFIILRVLNYRYKFLTSDRFDNRFITPTFREIDMKRAQQEKETVLPLNHRERALYISVSSKRLVKSEKVKLSNAAAVLGMTTLKLSTHMMADYALYWVLTVIRYHARFQSSLKAPNIVGLHVDGKGFLANLLKSIVNAFQPLGINMEIDTIPCLPDPIPPDFDRYIQIASLLVLCWILTIFEPYGLRLRHSVMCYYHPTRARQRAVWLYNHIMRSRSSFLKFARRQLRRKITGEKGIAKITCKEYLRANIKYKYLRFCLGPDEQQACLLCGEVFRESDSIKPIRCPKPGCPGLYCQQCFADLQNLCTVCMEPLQYGDLSDISEEKDSTGDETSITARNKIAKRSKKKTKKCTLSKCCKKDQDQDSDDEDGRLLAPSSSESEDKKHDSDYSTGATTDNSYTYQKHKDVNGELSVITSSRFSDVEKQRIPDHASWADTFINAPDSESDLDELKHVVVSEEATTVKTKAAQRSASSFRSSSGHSEKSTSTSKEIFKEVARQNDPEPVTTSSSRSSILSESIQNILTSKYQNSSAEISKPYVQEPEVFVPVGKDEDEQQTDVEPGPSRTKKPSKKKETHRGFSSFARPIKMLSLPSKRTAEQRKLVDPIIDKLKREFETDDTEKHKTVAYTLSPAAIPGKDGCPLFGGTIEPTNVTLPPKTKSLQASCNKQESDDKIILTDLAGKLLIAPKSHREQNWNVLSSPSRTAKDHQNLPSTLFSSPGPDVKPNSTKAKPNSRKSTLADLSIELDEFSCQPLPKNTKLLAPQPPIVPKLEIPKSDDSFDDTSPSKESRHSFSLESETTFIETPKAAPQRPMVEKSTQVQTCAKCGHCKKDVLHFDADSSSSTDSDLEQPRSFPDRLQNNIKYKVVSESPRSLTSSVPNTPSALSSKSPVTAAYQFYTPRFDKFLDINELGGDSVTKMNYFKKMADEFRAAQRKQRMEDIAKTKHASVTATRSHSSTEPTKVTLASAESEEISRPETYKQKVKKYYKQINNKQPPDNPKIATDENKVVKLIKWLFRKPKSDPGPSNSSKSEECSGSTSKTSKFADNSSTVQNNRSSSSLATLSDSSSGDGDLPRSSLETSTRSSGSTFMGNTPNYIRGGGDNALNSEKSGTTEETSSGTETTSVNKSKRPSTVTTKPVKKKEREPDSSDTELTDVSIFLGNGKSPKLQKRQLLGEKSFPSSGRKGSTKINKPQAAADSAQHKQLNNKSSQTTLRSSVRANNWNNQMCSVNSEKPTLRFSREPAERDQDPLSGNLRAMKRFPSSPEIQGNYSKPDDRIYKNMNDSFNSTEVGSDYVDDVRELKRRCNTEDYVRPTCQREDSYNEEDTCRGRRSSTNRCQETNCRNRCTSQENARFSNNTEPTRLYHEVSCRAQPKMVCFDDSTCRPPANAVCYNADSCTPPPNMICYDYPPQRVKTSLRRQSGERNNTYGYHKENCASYTYNEDRAEDGRYPLDYCACNSFEISNTGQRKLMEDEVSCSSDGSHQSEFPELVYQNTDDFLNLVNELGDTLSLRNKDRVQKAMREFEFMSSQNRNLEKPVFDSDSDDPPRVELSQKSVCKCSRRNKQNQHNTTKFTTINTRTEFQYPNLNSEAKHHEQHNQRRHSGSPQPKGFVENAVKNMNHNEDDLPQRYPKFKGKVSNSHWELNPRTGEWCKVFGDYPEDDYYLAPGMPFLPPLPRQNCRCERRSSRRRSPRNSPERLNENYSICRCPNCGFPRDQNVK